MADWVQCVRLPPHLITHLIKRPQFPVDAQVRKTGLRQRKKGTFGIPIHGVLILNGSLLTEYVMVQVEDVVPTFSLDVVGFPSFPVFGAKGYERKYPKQRYHHAQKHPAVTCILARGMKDENDHGANPEYNPMSVPLRTLAAARTPHPQLGVLNTCSGTFRGFCATRVRQFSSQEQFCSTDENEAVHLVT